MLPSKLSACFWIALIWMLITLSPSPVLAQEVPVLYGIFPQRGSAGDEVNLLLNGEGFLEFGRLRNVLLEGQRIPFSDYRVISNQFSRVKIELPEQASIRETEILFLFENFESDAYFIVMDQDEAQEMPLIAAYFPREGQRDSEMSLFFEGRGFPDLGEFGGLFIGDVEISIENVQVESDGSLRMDIYLPIETPLGETQIALFFENAGTEGPFIVFPSQPDIDEPRIPALGGVFPQEGRLETELVLTLEGENLFNLGGLIAVNIGGHDIPVINHRIVSANSLEITIYLPGEIPVGDQFIAVFFENLGFEDYFLVLGREPEPVEPGFPSLNNVSPHEGEADTDIEFELDGENLFELGALMGVYMLDYEIPVSYAEIFSAESMVVGIYLPEDAPAGEQIISFVFENASFDAPFFVYQPVLPPPPPGIPPVVIVVVVVVVVGILGVGGWRILRRPPKPTEQPKEKPDQPTPELSFIVNIDPGVQSVELVEPSLVSDVNIRFEVEVDKGDQHIESNGSSILSQE